MSHAVRVENPVRTRGCLIEIQELVSGNLVKTLCDEIDKNTVAAVFSQDRPS